MRIAIPLKGPYLFMYSNKVAGVGETSRHCNQQVDGSVLNSNGISDRGRHRLPKKAAPGYCDSAVFG